MTRDKHTDFKQLYAPKQMQRIKLDIYQKIELRLIWNVPESLKDTTYGLDFILVSNCKL